MDVVQALAAMNAERDAEMDALDPNGVYTDSQPAQDGPRKSQCHLCGWYGYEVKNNVCTDRDACRLSGVEAKIEATRYRLKARPDLGPFDSATEACMTAIELDIDTAWEVVR